MTRIVPALAAAFLVAGYAAVAQAQLGTLNNPPPQHLFSTGQPAPPNNGGSTMAERRAKLAATKRAHGTVRR